MKIGRLVKADLTLTMASGKLYADDELAESAEEFVSGSIAMETDDILDAVASVIYGATVKEKTVVYNTSDNPPPGGLTYYKKLRPPGPSPPTSHWRHAWPDGEGSFLWQSFSCDLCLCPLQRRRTRSERRSPRY